MGPVDLEFQLHDGDKEFNAAVSEDLGLRMESKDVAMMDDVPVESQALQQVHCGQQSSILNGTTSAAFTNHSPKSNTKTTEPIKLDGPLRNDSGLDEVAVTGDESKTTGSEVLEKKVGSAADVQV